MKPLNPIRQHAALRGGPRFGTWVPAPLAVRSTVHRAGSRFGSLPVAI
jgi:hypothetical protein